MAVLSRREDDGGFYTRINIGGIATRQVHPDAVRYLTKRGVYVGDEIPPELMRKLRSTKHWLFTKEEFPFVIFPEHKDPSFGTRRSSDKRTAIQGTTRVVASEPIRRRKKSRRSRADRNRAPVPAMPSRSKMNPGWKPDPTQWSEPLPLDPTGEPSIPDVLLSGQPSYPSGGQFETGPQRERLISLTDRQTERATGSR